MHKRTTAQTEDLDMVARFWSRQSKQCGREEHCLVIGMCDEEADALVAETGKRSPYDLRRVQPCCCQNDRNGEDKVELHAFALLLEMEASLLRTLSSILSPWEKKQSQWTRGVELARYLH